MSKFIQTMKSVSPRSALELGVAHALLLAGCVAGGLPYLALQALLAVELLLMSLATVVLYARRGALRHAWDLIKLGGTLAFVLFFLVVTYGVAAGKRGEPVLALALASLRDLDTAAIAWSLAYIVGSLAFALWQALRSDDPRLSWSKNQLGRGGATFVAMFFMVFVGVFVAQPLIGLARSFGLIVDAGLLLGVLMVLARYVTALVVSTFSESEWRELAAQPYADEHA